MKKILSLLLVSLTFLVGFNAKAEENNMTGKKVLVAYFSATGTTAGVAFEDLPEDWRCPRCRQPKTKFNAA